MNYTFITVEHIDRVGIITLNRPEKRNALHPQLITELKFAFTDLENDVNTKVILIQNNGQAFCAGADLSYLQSLQSNTYQENLDDSNHLKQLFYQIYKCSKIVVAKVQGAALAGGCGLAAVCDLVYTTPESTFGFTEVKIGFIPAIVMVFLLKKINQTYANELLLTGQIITSTEALRMGMVNEIFNVDEINDKVNLILKQIVTQTSAQAVSTTKAMIQQVQQMNMLEALDYAAAQNATARASNDCKTGIEAFLNKQKLIW